AVRGTLAARLRDFDEAERLLGRALALDPQDAWLHVERGVVHELADEYEAALEAADRGLALAPWYRPAVDLRAHVLVLLGREDEAVALLQAGLGRLEAASTAEALLQLQVERGEHAAAEATLDRIEALTPLRAPAYAAWLEGRRSDVAYHLGDRARAIAHARRSGHPFYLALAERLEAAGEGARRVVLPVPFVRQHHMTCAPATLSAICAYHGVEAAHLGIAEVICYDGTPDHAERRWAAGRGFAVRELTVTFDAARALLDRGLPFTLCAVDPGNSHLQAVVGYDEARRTLLLRDPYFRSLIEITEGWLDDHRPSGPRGMALAPPGRHALLDGLDLPEADRHDLYHRLQAALVDHDRPAAAACAEALASLAPRHRLTLQGERSLASYDGNEERRLAATEALLELFPDDVNLRGARQGSLATLGRRQARIDWLRAEQARRPHPLLAQALADALHDDARHQPEAVALARATVRQRPADGLGYHILADALWGAGAQEEAAQAYRVAACLERTNEHYAEAYFRACRCLGRTEEGLAFLERRFERHGRKSSQPAVTLVEALDALDRDAEGLAALERALAWRPDDGPLLLFAARTHALAGQGARAAALLEGARGAAHEADVLRTRARLDELRGELSSAADAWAGVLALEPFNTRAAQAATRLLAETRDRRAAVGFLRRHVERFPHHQELGRLLVGWLDEEPPEVVEAELRRLVATDPADAWSWRELALHLSRLGRGAEAQAALERAAAVEPACTSLENVRSSLLADAGRAEEARAALRASLALEVDQDWAIGRLLALAGDAAGRAAELRFLRAEIVRQVGFGDALLAYQRQAAGVLPPDELLAQLREAHAARPDLWHAAVAVGRQLLLLERPGEARALLDEAARRFPLLPRVWVELAQVHHVRGDLAAERQVLARALELQPAWREPALRLAELLHGAGDLEAERALLVRTLRHAPADALLHGWLADALRGLDRPDEAIEELQRAVRLDPGYGWAAVTLEELCAARGRPELPVALAEALVAERPLDPRAWLVAG
ncbi:MAG TPA: tetratricopeptide repeat protein, partial [Anaeromyxobacteraceae bacterium]|nr:tetratricopeptide repeat protein [Anaeromyxobacteraceae bacterium]